MSSNALFVIAYGEDQTLSFITQPKISVSQFNDWDNEEVVFFYNETDRTQHGIPLRKFMTPKMWERLKKNEKWKLVISYVTDYYNAYDLHQWINLFERYDMQEHMHKVSIGCLDINFQKLVHDTFFKKQFTAPTTYTQPVWLNQCYRINKQNNPTPTKKFSLFSRNFKEERLDFFVRLYDLGLLNTSTVNFTFWNTNPYIDKGNGVLEYSVEEMKSMYEKWRKRHQSQLSGNSNHPEKLLDKFLSNAPYVLNDLKFSKSRVTQKWDNTILEAMQDSCFHIVMESHFKHYAREFTGWESNTDYNTPMFLQQVDPEYGFGLSYKTFAPSFITEKTYKALISGRPFLGFASAYYLENIRNMGFKTFSPWIDESYDSEENDEQRMKMILDELKRLDSMKLSEMISLLDEMQEITEYNRQHLYDLAASYKLPEKLSWIGERSRCMEVNYYQR